VVFDMCNSLEGDSRSHSTSVSMRNQQEGGRKNRLISGKLPTSAVGWTG
jgi:hypothetical protein